MKHIMCDLETFDTKPSALVISIGAVRFDPALGAIGQKYVFPERGRMVNAGRAGVMR